MKFIVVLEKILLISAVGYIGGGLILNHFKQVQCESDTAKKMVENYFNTWGTSVENITGIHTVVESYNENICSLTATESQKHEQFNVSYRVFMSEDKQSVYAIPLSFSSLNNQQKASNSGVTSDTALEQNLNAASDNQKSDEKGKHFSAKGTYIDHSCGEDGCYIFFKVNGKEEQFLSRSDKLEQFAEENKNKNFQIEAEYLEEHGLPPLYTLTSLHVSN